ncbi:MAG: UPF0164 family protein, partial [Elusimicrobia bacterium]|nr:UPF0164 family protein [Elusimicrobiota bacterium]
MMFNFSKIKYLYIPVFIIIFLSLPELPYCAPGNSSAEFILLDIGARPSGMGGAFTAVDDDINAISYNPAGLGAIKDKRVSFMHNEWIEGIGYEYAGIGCSLGNYGTAGLEIKYMHTDKIQGRSLNGKVTNPFTSSNFAGAVSYGKKVTE